VVAGLLHEAGHEVIGATLQLYDHGSATRSGKTCCAGQDIMDARNVADRLGIPHYVLDREAVFRRDVIDAFADSYARGETPIPCIACNQTVKFRDLVTLARDLGCEALATGHYARRVEGPAGPELHRAADPARDQSYFLAATTREQLGFARFPLGDMPDKAAVRAVAARFALPVAEKPDSQDICFVPEGRYDALVGRLRPEALAPGEVVAADGHVLGAHEGIARYTVGQGRGLGPASWDGGERLFVAGVDAPRRRVIVAPRGVIETDRATAGEVNWLIEPPAAAIRCAVKLRAREAPRPARIAWDAEAGTLAVTLDAPGIVAPGQACVLYDRDRVLGGGFLRARGSVDSARDAA
jgi:tRNA-specific 2-thiouridylase